MLTFCISIVLLFSASPVVAVPFLQEGTDQEGGIQDMLDQLDEASVGEKLEIMRQLGKLEGNAAIALPKLREYLTSDSVLVRCRALCSIIEISGECTDEIAGLLSECATNPAGGMGGIRFACQEVLVKHYECSLSTIVERLTSEDRTTVLLMCHLVEKIGRSATVATSRLEDLVLSEDTQVATAVIEALKSIGTSEAYDAIQKGLSTTNTSVRAQARAILYEAGKLESRYSWSLIWPVTIAIVGLVGVISIVLYRRSTVAEKSGG